MSTIVEDNNIRLGWFIVIDVEKGGKIREKRPTMAYIFPSKQDVVSSLEWMPKSISKASSTKQINTLQKYLELMAKSGVIQDITNRSKVELYRR